MSNCPWTLDVTVFVIDMKHAEKRGDKFCCCDDGDKDCKDSLSEVGMCEGNCDLLLNVTVSPCTESLSSGPCSVITDEIKDAENFDEYGFFFHSFFTSQPLHRPVM